MKIGTLIATLESLQNEHGNLEIKICHPDYYDFNGGIEEYNTFAKIATVKYNSKYKNFTLFSDDCN